MGVMEQVGMHYISLMGRIIRAMSVAQINEQTKSKGMTSPNVIYRVVRKSVATVTLNSEGGEIVEDLVDLEEGDLIARAGCGSLHDSGYSFFKIGDNWGRVPNRDVEHYANPILADVQE